MQRDAHKTNAELLAELRELRQRNSELEALLADKTAAEENLGAVSETALDAVIISDQDGNIVFWNKAATGIFGYEAEEVLGNPSTMLIPERLIGDYEKVKEKFLQTGVSSYANKPRERVAKRKDGTEIIVETTVSSWKIQDKYYFGSSLRDISEQRQTEILLQESEKRFKDIFEFATDGIIIADGHTRKFIDGNNAICQMLGYSREELRDLSAEKIHLAEDLPFVVEQFDKMVKGGAAHAIELPTQRKDGSVFYAELIARSLTLDGRQCLVGFFRDVTERKRAEEERERILNMSHDLICTAGMDGYFKYANPAWERLLGYSREELLARPFLDFIHPEDHYKNDAAVEKLSSGKMLSDFENRYIHKDGSIRTISWTATPLSEQGLMYCVGRDITERKRHEEVLKESEARFRTVAESSSDAILIADQSDAIIFWNTASTRLFGYEAWEMLGKSYSCLLPERLREQDRKAGQRFLETGKLPNNKSPFETIALRKGGSEFPVEITFSEWKTKGQYYFSFIIRDITKRKQSEQDLINSKVFLENIYNATADVIMISDEKGYVTSVNIAVEKMLGFSQKELIGQHTSEFFPKDEKHNQIGLKMITDLREKGFIKNLEANWLRKDGSLCPIELNITRLLDRDGKVLGGVANIRDVTERRQQEVVLRESEERFRAITESSPDAIFIASREGRILYCNKSAERIYGYTAEELIGRHPEVLGREIDRPIYRKNWDNYTKSKKSFLGKTYEGVAIHKNGTEFPVEVSTSSWVIDTQQYISAVARNITERKQQEQALQEREARFRAIAESSPDAIITADSSGKILYCNRSAERIYGYAAAELMKKSIPDLEHPTLRNTSKKRVKKLVEAGFPNYIGGTVEGIGVRKDGSIFVAEVAQSQWKIGDQIVLGGIVRDITDRKKLEEQLKKSHTELEKKVKRRTAELREVNEKLKISEAHLKSFAGMLLAARETERKNISTSIHDELGSMAIAVDSQISIAREECNQNNKQATFKALGKAQAALRKAVGDLRRIAVDLRPPNLEIMGLTAALTELLDKTKEQTKLRIIFRNELGNKKIREDAAIVIYRVIQEALTNITKHAKAKNVRVSLHADKKGINLDITDDGVGCDFNKVLYRKGVIKIGIEGMKERVESLGGVFIISSALKQGTQIKVTLRK